MLKIKNLIAEVQDEKRILNGLSLNVPKGQVHAVMGQNGSGKSTLSSVLMGDTSYQVSADSCQFNGQDLLSMSADERSRAGVFLAYQSPVAISGVNNMVFLKAILNKQRQANNLPELDVYDVMQKIKEAASMVGLDESFLLRDLNNEFSGGERKRNEILQMLLLEPKFCVLDEIDSGLDVDALRSIAENVNRMRSPERSFLLITHYQRLLDLIKPDVIHIMVNGLIKYTGGPDLAKKIEKHGFAWLTEGEMA